MMQPLSGASSGKTCGADIHKGVSCSSWRKKGISRDLALAVLQESDDDVGPDEQSELAAALIYARKKSVGPFACPLPSCPQDRQKHMGRLARNGFSFDVVRRVMDSAQARMQTSCLMKSIRTARSVQP